MQQKPYQKKRFPKQEYLERTIATRPESVGIWREEALDPKWTAIGIRDEKGNIIKIGLDDLLLNPAEQEMISFSKQLIKLSRQVYDAFGRICIKQRDIEDSTRVNRFLKKNRPKYDSRIRPILYFIADAIFRNGYVEFERFIERGRNLWWDKLYYAAASLNNTVLEARARGNPVKEFNSKALEGAKALIKKGEEYLQREKTLTERFLVHS